MAAIIRPNYMRSVKLVVTYDNTTESDITSGSLELAPGAALLGPAGLFEVRAKKIAGQNDDSIIRVYNDSAKTIQLYEQTHSFSQDGDWVAFQLVRDEVVAAGEQPHVTVQAGAGTGHKVQVWVSLTVAAVQ